MVLAVAISVIAFVVFGRYRLPIVPLLILFAAAGVVEVTRASAERQWRPLFVAGIAALTTGLLANVTVFNPQQRLAISFYNWAYVLTGANRTEEAIQVNREALRLDPKMAEAHYNLGTLLASGRQFAEAIIEFRAAIDLREAYPEAWNNLGAALAMTGDRRGAAAALMRALIQDPGHPGARENLEGMLGMAMEADEEDLRTRIEAFLQLPLQ
jgi:tetratricopeptide (TPR) repeat protein